ncbi:MAG: acylneuraminate cytidylyltransferase family protein [Candidatus Omnitrophica bacterium]|nr:acylneuraminate cytidylyltransferase family protein [Candidatus Omnitrophota bacterium]
MGKILAIIPARSGSKGVTDKNIRFLGGYPLIAYSIAVAKLVKNIERIIVSTDSQEYADIAKDYGAEVPFLRPSLIAGDKSGDYDFLKHAIDWLQEKEGYRPEYIVHLRPTTPFREAHYIEGAIEAIKKDTTATALRSLHEMSESAYKTFEIENGYMKSVFSGRFDIEASNLPRQMVKTTYDANGYVDVVRTSYILEHEKIHGDKVIAYITPRAYEVDTPEDFEYLEYLINKNPMLVKNLFK